jgi:hypothetical protein
MSGEMFPTTLNDPLVLYDICVNPDKIYIEIFKGKIKDTEKMGYVVKLGFGMFSMEREIVILLFETDDLGIALVNLGLILNQVIEKGIEVLEQQRIAISTYSMGINPFFESMVLTEAMIEIMVGELERTGKFSAFGLIHSN